jgi:hypothetical protein
VYPAGRSCVRGNITAATLQDNLFLVRYDCTQLESCLGSHVLRANLDPLLQHPLPAECQRIVKAKLTQVCRWAEQDRGGGHWPMTNPSARLRSTQGVSLRTSCSSSLRWSTSTPVLR